MFLADLYYPRRMQSYYLETEYSSFLPNPYEFISHDNISTSLSDV
jgi:hypothetical protein